MSASQAAGLARLRRRGFWLEYASMAWMTAEAAVAVTAGVLASSIALVGFGLDSVIELFAAAIVVWQLRGENEGEERETRAVRLIGVTFFVLAAYLAVEGIRDLVTQARPGQSAAGLAVAGTALIVMPALAVAKRRTGRALGNRTLIADSAETAFCAFTSAATLFGVGLNTWLGWWWADPAAAQVIAALAVKEGLEAWEGEAGDLRPQTFDCPSDIGEASGVKTALRGSSTTTTVPLSLLPRRRDPDGEGYSPKLERPLSPTRLRSLLNDNGRERPAGQRG